MLLHCGVMEKGNRCETRQCAAVSHTCSGSVAAESTVTGSPTLQPHMGDGADRNPRSPEPVVGAPVVPKPGTGSPVTPGALTTPSEETVMSSGAAPATSTPPISARTRRP